MSNPHTLRTIYGIDDDLQAFAERFLNAPLNPDMGTEMWTTGPYTVTRLHRDGKFQVEMFCIPGPFTINPHRHPNCDTIEVPVSGLVRLTVNGEEPFAKFSDQALEKMRWRGLRINHNDLHGGTVADGGAMFLSIQRWTTAPGSVETDYVGPSNCAEHHARVAHA